MRDSPWIASEDLEARDPATATVTIAKVLRYAEVEFEAGRKKENLYSLAFSETKRQLVINQTNRKTLVELFGQDTRNWIGNKVVLYVQDGIKVGGERKKGIRIRRAAQEEKKTRQAATDSESGAAAKEKP